MSTFSKKLKAVRTGKGWSLREVEKRSEVSRQTVLRAESGKFISLDVLWKLFTTYNLTGKPKDEMLQDFVASQINWAREAQKAKKPQRSVKARKA